MSGESTAFRLPGIHFPIFGIVGRLLLARRHKPELAVPNRLNMDAFVPVLVLG